MARTPANLDEIDVPVWFATSAEGLQPVRRGWAKHLPPIALRAGGELPRESFAWTVAALIQTETEAAIHDVVEGLLRFAQTTSLDRWVDALFAAWGTADFPDKEAWVIRAAAMLGGQQLVGRLREAMRQWEREKRRHFVVQGVDALAKIGNTAALQEIATTSVGSRDRRIADDARETLRRKAERSGRSLEEMEDELVSDFGLDGRGERVFDFGARQFRARFDHSLELSLFDDAGKRRTRMPPVGKRDDPAVTHEARQRWIEMKAGIKRLVKAQVQRFERAMLSQRTWTARDFEQRVLGHPVTSRIAALLVWQKLRPAKAGDWQNLRIAEDLTLADTDDKACAIGQQDTLRIAHPLWLGDEQERDRWIGLLTDYGLVQPFSQLQRDCFRCRASESGKSELTPEKTQPIPAGVLYGILNNEGWQLGTPIFDDGIGISDWIWRYFEGDGISAVLRFNPGFVISNLGGSGEQKIQKCQFYQGKFDERETAPASNPIPLGKVPTLSYSEVRRRLVRLTAAAPN